MHDRGRADRAAGVACRRRQIHLLEWRPPINLAVRHRVHRAAAGEREIIARVFLCRALEQRQERLLVGRLDRARDILVLLLQRIVGSRGGPSRSIRLAGKAAPTSGAQSFQV